MSFVPSYGASTPAAATPPLPAFDMQALVQQFAPTAIQAITGKDAREEEAIVRAKIDNYKRMMVTPPYSIVPGRPFYENEIAKMKARLAVLKTKAAEETTAAAATADWRQLGQYGIAAGALAAIALAGLFTATSIRVLRRNPTPAQQRTKDQYHIPLLLISTGATAWAYGRLSAGASLNPFDTSFSSTKRK